MSASSAARMVFASIALRSDSRAMRTATWGCPATRAIVSRAWSRSFSSGSPGWILAYDVEYVARTAAAMPQRPASSALTMRPVRIISAAFRLPTARASRSEPP